MTTLLSARAPEDLLAAVPIVLGFAPEESLVMLTFGAVSTFHARLDLPPSADSDALAETVSAVLTPSRTHEVEHVAFVVYTGDSAAAASLAAALVPAFVAEGIGVVGVLRAHDGHWCNVPIRAGAVETTPTPYQNVAHPFTAQAVFAGRVTHASRDELRRTLERDVGVHERWGLLGRQLPESAADGGAGVRDLVAGWVASGAEPDDEGAVRVLRAVMHVEVRDVALCAVTRETAQDHLRVWAALLRGAADEQVPDTAAVTAFCAWQHGDGALAWCALDRCFDIDPGHRLGTCLAECLSQAVSPMAWSEVDTTACAASAPETKP